MGDLTYIAKFRESTRMSLILTDIKNGTKECIVMWAVI